MYKEVSIGSATRSINVGDREGWGFHHKKRPALTRYGVAGPVRANEWYRDGQLHRDNGAAFIEYNYGFRVPPGDTRNFEQVQKTGAIIYASWYLNGRCQRYESF